MTFRHQGLRVSTHENHAAIDDGAAAVIERLRRGPKDLAAWQQVEPWLARDIVWMPLPTERHIGILAELPPSPGIRANLVPEAHLAALAIGHGLTLMFRRQRVEVVKLTHPDYLIETTALAVIA